MKKKEDVHRREETTRDMIPDYEYLFSEEETRNKNKSKVNLFGKIFKQNFFRFMLGFLVDIVKTSPVWVVPVITAKIIDLATAGMTDTTVSTLIIYSIIIAVLLFQNIPTTMLLSHITNKLLRKISGGLKYTVIRKLQHLSITYHNETETGKIHSKFIKDLDNVDLLFRNIVSVLIPAIFSVIVATAISLYNSAIVTLFFVFIIPLNLIVVSFFRNKVRSSFRNYRKENENISSKLNNMLEMLPLTKAHGLEQTELTNFQKNIAYLVDKGNVVDSTNACFGSVTWVVSNFLSCVCLVFCAILALNGKISAGDIVLYQSMFSSINGSVNTIINVFPTFSSGFDSLESISEIMYSTNIEDDKNKIKVGNIDGRVKFENVNYHYPDSEQLVVKDFNLDVKQGECIAVVGSSGSGKTTIMNMIIGFLKPSSGKVYIDDKDITTLSLSDYRHNISVVPQNSILFSGSIKDNITYGLGGISNEKIREVAEMANLNEFVDELPNGLDTLIGERGSKLSGGQRQRITIARALIRNPKILILDEATSALDNISEYHVQKAISKLIKGRTTFIVAHRLSTIRDADRIVVMEQGECVEVGTYDELMSKKGKFYDLKNLNDMNYKKAEEGLS